MTTVIAATDRRDSNSLNVARQYVESIEAQGTDVQLLSLTDLPPDFFTEGRYGTPPPSFEQVLHKYISGASHFIFVVPEYNGSFPGVLKFFLDIVPPGIWAGKKAALAGVATGRAGNLRGLDHLTAVLHYLKVEVFHQKPYFSSIHLHLDKDQKFANQEYNSLLELQVSAFADF